MAQRIFISYSWTDTDDINRLDNQFLRFQIKLTRDIRDLTYNTSIHNFMDTIQQHDKLILYVSDSYLRSINCMYEASQALEMKDKVVLILKKGTRVFSPEDKIDLINYWKDKLQKFSQTDPKRLKSEIDDITIAYNCISDFIDFVKQDNRMDNQNVDFDTLLDLLKVEKAYPQIITSPVYDWIAQYPYAKLFDVISLINDLYRSKSMECSEFPNIPEEETNYLFNGIKFENEMNGITLLLSITNIKNGAVNTILYSHLVGIEENSMRSEYHSKYYFLCENPCKKQAWYSNVGVFRAADSNVQSERGYIDTFRLILHF